MEGEQLLDHLHVDIALKTVIKPSVLSFPNHWFGGYYTELSQLKWDEMTIYMILNVKIPFMIDNPPCIKTLFVGTVYSTSRTGS